MFIAGTEIYKFRPVRDDTKIDRVAKYIMNQKKTSQKEIVSGKIYAAMERFNISYEEQFILKDIKD